MHRHGDEDTEHPIVDLTDGWMRVTPPAKQHQPGQSCIWQTHQSKLFFNKITCKEHM